MSLADYWIHLAKQDQLGDDVHPSKQAEHAERMFEAADMRRESLREEAYEQTEAGDRLWSLET